MREALFWLVPPVIGAVIGYITNAVAIKMLFRPLKEVRLFCAGRLAGIRLPFTPGILPRERHKLALSIGAMVERELFTPELLRERLRREPVRNGIDRAVASYTANFLALPLGSFLPALPGPETPSGGKGGEEGKRAFPEELVSDFLCSENFGKLLDALIKSTLEKYLRQRTNDAGSDSKSIFDVSPRTLLGSKKIDLLREKGQAFIREALNSKTSAIPANLRSFLEGSYNAAVEGLLNFLRKEEIHREIEIQGKVFLNNAISKFSVFQRFFISAGQYDRTLSDRMGEIIDDLLTQLEGFLLDPAHRERIISFLLDTVLTMASKPESYKKLVEFLSEAILSFGDRPLGEILRALGITDPRALPARIRGFLSAPGTVSAFKKGVIRFLEENRDMKTAELLSFDQGKKDRLDAMIGEKIISLADEEMVRLLNTIDVGTMVSDRIDALEMIKVERIVLDVMAGQLKWINLFGGLLGALIGFFQAVFSAIMRG
jgi:uncharacterized membrane protein YheB (UPF0754 family)